MSSARRSQPSQRLAPPAAAVFLDPARIVAYCSVVLAMLGVAILFSASLSVDATAPYRFIEKQTVWVLCTLVVGYVVTRIDLEGLRRFTWTGYGLCALALILVLIPGIGASVNGSRSWIRFGNYGFQVAEFAKIGLIFALAHYFGQMREEVRSFRRGFLVPCLLVGLVVGLVMLQTDLGTALVISLVSFLMLYLAGTRLLFLIPSALAILAAVGALVSFDQERFSRLTAFMDMEAQKSGDAYQVWQAILAFAGGGLNGVGLGNGRQQLRSLPEAHNDFIFAIVGEELGLVATLAVLAVFVTLFVAGLLHLRKAPTAFYFILASGCLLNISVQALLNLGVVTGSLPTTGLPLPFISYGGSNFLAMGVCVAILLNTNMAWREPALKNSRRKLKEIQG